VGKLPNFALSDEVIEITHRAIEPLVERLLLRWQAETAVPTWRLPPDGWLLPELRKAHPELIFPTYEYPGDPDGCDAIARRVVDRRLGVVAPFQPVTVHREEDPLLLEALQQQELANLDVFRRHPGAVVGVKHNGNPSGVAQLFADPDLETQLPADTVVYHQMGRRHDTSTRNRFTNRFVEHHLRLAEGALVRYEHALASTPRAYWFQSVNPTPRWLNTLDGAETGLRLELNPRAGVYLGDRAGAIAGTHLGTEKELLLPPGTTWRVVGIRDVIQGDHRPHDQRKRYERLRTVQMIEVDPATVEGEPVEVMTSTFDPFAPDLHS